MNAIHRKRLLNVARALRESPNPKKFDMYRFGYGCGTPACALGHYAARRDLQREFVLVTKRTGENDVKDRNGDSVLDRWMEEWHERVQQYFGITHDEAEELFGADGCGGAKRPLTAAKYITRFVERHS